MAGFLDELNFKITGHINRRFLESYIGPYIRAMEAHIESKICDRFTPPTSRPNPITITPKISSPPSECASDRPDRPDRPNL